MKIVSAKIYVGAGLEPERGGSRKHRTVIDSREIWPTVEEVVGRRFEGSTITKGRGRWQGRGEPSLVVEVWDKASNAQQFFARVAQTAREIVDALDQVSVAAVTDDGGQKNVSYFGGAVAHIARLSSGKHRIRG